MTYAYLGLSEYLSGTPSPLSAQGSGSAIRFNASGQIAEYVTAAGQSSPLAFAAQGNASTPIAASGQTLWSGYAARGNAVQGSGSGIATWLNLVSSGVLNNANPISGAVLAFAFSAAGAAGASQPAALTYYVQFGLTAWQPNTLYAVGNRVSNGGNAYICTGAGRSQNVANGGPAGTGASLTDGTAVWAWMSRIDYTSIQSFANSLPTTLTQPIVAYLCGTYNNSTASGPYLTLSGHATTTVNSITLKPLPGYGFRDAAQPLAFNANATSFATPAISGGWNWFDISDSNVIFDGLQFQQANNDNCTLIQTELGSVNVQFNGCVIDGYSQPGGAELIVANGKIVMRNCLVVDRQSASGSDWTIDVQAGGTFINNTIIGINAPTALPGLGTRSTASATLVRNCVFSGFGLALYAETAGVLTVDHSAFTASNYGANVGNGGSNLLGANPGFAASGTDFRLVPFISSNGVASPFSPTFSTSFGAGAGAGASANACIDAGVSDLQDLPFQNDIFYTKRPSGSAWDIGAFEYVATHPITLLSISAQGTAASGVPASGSATTLLFAATGTAATANAGYGSALCLTIQGGGSIGQEDLGRGSSTVLTFSAAGSRGVIPNAAAGTATYSVLSASGAAMLQSPVTGSATFLAFSAAGSGSIPVAAVGAGRILAFAGAGTALQGVLASGTGQISFSAQGAVMPSGTAAGASGAITFGASGQLIFPNGLYGASTALGISASGFGLQEDKGSGKAEWLAFITLGRMQTYTVAAGTGTALSWSGSGAGVNPKPWTGAATALTFGASGSVSEFTTASGLANAIVVGSNGSAYIAESISGSANALVWSSGGTLTTNVFASGLAQWIGISGNGTASQYVQGYGVARPLAFNGQGAAGKETLAGGSVPWLPLSLSGAAQQIMLAHGTGGWGFSAAGALSSAVAAGSGAFGFTAQGAAIFADPMYGVATFAQFSGMGTVVTSVNSAGASTPLAFGAQGWCYQIPTGGQIDEIVTFPRDDRLIYFRT